MLKYKIKWISIFLLLAVFGAVLWSIVAPILHIPVDCTDLLSIIYGYILGTICIIMYMLEA